MLTLCCAALGASGFTYINPAALQRRAPLSQLILRSPNPRVAFSFVEAQLCRGVLDRLRYQPPSGALLQRLVAGGGGQLAGIGGAQQLSQLFAGPYRRLVQPIYKGLLPYYLYNRGG